MAEATKWEKPQLLRVFADIERLSTIEEVNVTALEKCQVLDLCVGSIPPKELVYDEVVKRYDALNYSSDVLINYLKSMMDEAVYHNGKDASSERIIQDLIRMVPKRDLAKHQVILASYIEGMTSDLA